jgi:hypothetical protein
MTITLGGLIDSLLESESRDCSQPEVGNEEPSFLTSSSWLLAPSPPSSYNHNIIAHEIFPSLHRCKMRRSA